MSFAGVNQTTPLGSSVSNTVDPLDSGTVTVPANGMAAEFEMWAKGALGCAADPQPTDGGVTKRFGIPDSGACANNGLANSQGAFGATRDTTGSFVWDASDSSWAVAVAIPINAAAIAAVTARRRVVIVQ